MRYLMETYATKGIGFPEDGFLKAVETVAGSDFHEFYHTVAQSHEQLDYNRYLRQAGLTVEVSLQPASIYLGIEFEQGESNSVRIRRVVANSPAERAKLDVGDLLIAMNDERLTFENFRSRRHPPTLGETINRPGERTHGLLPTHITPVSLRG